MCAFPLDQQLNKTMKMLRQRDRADSFFDIISIEGRDDVFDEMENRIENLVNGAMDFLLDCPSYDLKASHTSDNPHVKVDLEVF